jgi:D-aminoacyl-tRNA deacylase
LRMIIYSQSDPAGKNIANHLRNAMQFIDVPAGEYPYPAWKSGDFLLAETTARLIELSLDTQGARWLLCLSRHRSESGKRCLTVHTPGNLTAHADLGGEPSQVGISNPALQARLLAELKAEKDRLGISEEVTVEATHHGPTALPCPITFVEIGSDEEAWQDTRLGQCMAQAVARALTREDPPPPNAIGVGGGHYSEKFTSLMLEQRYSIGHIIPKYAMTGGMANEMFSRCIERTWGGITAVVVDWKGTPSTHKEHLKAFAASLGIELVRV